MEETEISDGPNETQTIVSLQQQFLEAYSRYDSNLSRIKTLLSFKSKRKRKEMKRLHLQNKNLVATCHFISKKIEELRAQEKGDTDE